MATKKNKNVTHVNNSTSNSKPNWKRRSSRNKGKHTQTPPPPKSKTKSKTKPTTKTKTGVATAGVSSPQNSHTKVNNKQNNQNKKNNGKTSNHKHIQTALKRKRSALDADHQHHWKAQVRETELRTTISCLRTQCDELEQQLRHKKQELQAATMAQRHALRDCHTHESKKRKTQQEYDDLVESLYQNTPLSVVERRRDAATNAACWIPSASNSTGCSTGSSTGSSSSSSSSSSDSSSSCMEIQPTTPSNNNRSNANNKTKNTNTTVAARRQVQQNATNNHNTNATTTATTSRKAQQNGNNTLNQNRTIRIVTPPKQQQHQQQRSSSTPTFINSINIVNHPTPNNNSGGSTLQKTMTKEKLIHLAQDASRSNVAKAQLILYMTSVPIKTLHQLLELPSAMHARSLSSYEAADLMRMCVHGSFHLRSDFQARVSQDEDLYQWLISKARGGILLSGSNMEDKQRRLIAILDLKNH